MRSLERNVVKTGKKLNELVVVDVVVVSLSSMIRNKKPSSNEIQLKGTHDTHTHTHKTESIVYRKMRKYCASCSIKLVIRFYANRDCNNMA